MDRARTRSMAPVGPLVLACLFVLAGCAKDDGQAASSPTAPPPMCDVVCPATQPVQFAGSIEIGQGSLANGRTEFFVVPKGKALTIEHITARALDLAPSDSLAVDVVTTVDGVMVEHRLGLVGPEGRTAIDPYSSAAQFLSEAVRIYASPGTPVGVGANRLTRDNGVVVSFAMSGHYVDVP